MNINKLFLLLIYLSFGYLLGLYYGYQKTFISHGPNSNIIRKNIYYEINNDMQNIKILKYRLKPEIIIE